VIRRSITFIIGRLGLIFGFGIIFSTILPSLSLRTGVYPMPARIPTSLVKPCFESCLGLTKNVGTSYSISASSTSNSAETKDFIWSSCAGVDSVGSFGGGIGDSVMIVDYSMMFCSIRRLWDLSIGFLRQLGILVTDQTGFTVAKRIGNPFWLFFLPQIGSYVALVFSGETLNY